MPKAIPTHQKLETAMEIVYTEMGHLFAYWIWWTRAKPLLLEDENFRNDKTSLIFLQNAAVTTSLLAIRKLNEFFRARPADDDERDDDLRAYDFGFGHTGAVLNPEDFKEIHKRIAHMTYRQVDFGKVSYELYDAVGLLLPRCKEFLDHVRGTLYADRETEQKEVQIMQAVLCAMRQKWEEGKRQQQGTA